MASKSVPFLTGTKSMSGVAGVYPVLDSQNVQVGFRLTYYKGMTKYFNMNGQLHREYGPAVEESFRIQSFTKRRETISKWYYEGKKHRLTGPAIVIYGDSRYSSYYIHDQPIDTLDVTQWRERYNLERSWSELYGQFFYIQFKLGKDVVHEASRWIDYQGYGLEYHKWSNNTKSLFKLKFY